MVVVVCSADGGIVWCGVAHIGDDCDQIKKKKHSDGSQIIIRRVNLTTPLYIQ